MKSIKLFALLLCTVGANVFASEDTSLVALKKNASRVALNDLENMVYQPLINSGPLAKQGKYYNHEKLEIGFGTWIEFINLYQKARTETVDKDSLTSSNELNAKFISTKNQLKKDKIDCKKDRRNGIYGAIWKTVLAGLFCWATFDCIKHYQANTSSIERSNAFFGGTMFGLGLWKYTEYAVRDTNFAYNAHKCIAKIDKGLVIENPLENIDQ